MKFDAFNFSEVQPNVETKAPQGRLLVRCSHRAALYLTVEGYEVLVGSGFDFDLKTEGHATFRVEVTEPAARAFFYDPRAEVFEPTPGEVFTNIDRKPMESGSVLAVQQAVRSMRIEHQQLMRQMRESAAALEVKPAADPEVKPEAVKAADPVKADPVAPDA